MQQNSFLGRGINDYLYAKDSMKDQTQKEYNWPAVIFAQAAEKLLKAVIEVEFVEDSQCIGLMRTHNLRTIVAKILEKFPDAKLNAKDCKWLGDFYFDARYPGDDFIVVTLEDGLEAMRIVENILKEVEKILTSKEARSLFEQIRG
ncbi:HEPN domain-containing protein [Sporanaerobium hydrogeniformans]|uniref:HEPN domain-containing protein n=1 Tax=Sporanaerobium hydrogeniformans TaxID=3072179 RepID=UPI0015D50285|nr:HEPN domain-containing protein [Sporanaerobium hydrogeniformans]